MIYAVGDVHGDIQGLRRILGLISEDAEARGIARPRTVFLGDYVDRGVASAEVLDLLSSGNLPVDPIFLLGMHGLTLDGLMSEGMPVEEAARRLNEDLNGLTLLSDNVGFDARWLSDLHDAAGIPGGYLLDELTRGFARTRRLYPTVKDGAAKLSYEMVSEAGLTAHRALDDALRGALLIAALAVLAGRVERGAMVERVREAKANWGRADEHVFHRLRGV